jgi:hypothetical protein
MKIVPKTMIQNVISRYKALIMNDSLTRTLEVSLVTISMVLLIMNTSPFNAYAQQGGSATSGPATGGSASGPGATGGSATSGPATGGAANGPGATGGSATSGPAIGGNATNSTSVQHKGPF